MTRRQPAGYVSPIPDFGKQADGRYNTLWPNTLCITPGATQYIYANSMLPGQIQKFTLDGKLVGQFGDRRAETRAARLGARAVVRRGERNLDW